MNTKLLTGGLALALLMVSMPANAYHIIGGSAGGGSDSHQWNFSSALISPADEPCVPASPANFAYALIWGQLSIVPVVGPILVAIFGPNGCLFDPALEEGDVLFALILCEQDDIIGLPGLPVISKSGDAGLCFMSPGNESDGSGGCQWIGNANQGGRSNGYGPEYDGVANPSGSDCEVRSDLIGAVDDLLWPGSLNKNYWFEMDGFSFSMQVGSASCSPSLFGALDMVYAYLFDDGHVAGFPESGAGSYEVHSGLNGGVNCVVGAPLYN